MVCHIFWPKAKRSKAAHGKRPKEQERAAVEDLNDSGTRREALGVGRLSHRWWLEPIVSQPSEIQMKSALIKDSQTIKGVVEQNCIKRENLKAFEKVRDFCGITCNTCRTSHERSLYSRNCSRRL